MTTQRTTAASALLILFAALQGCGGGDGDAPAPPGPTTTPLTYPASGSYGWTLKATGDTASLKHGLSLVHPSLPDNEYIVEAPTSAISDTSLVTSGVVNGGQHTVSAIEPYALAYIFGGDVRVVPMQANGSAPPQQVQRSNTSSACRFVLAALDYATPANSRFIVSTGGSDGRCDTSADEGRAEVRLLPGNTIEYTILTSILPLGVVRDSSTMVPRGWIHGRGVSLWNGTQITTRAAGTPAINRVLATTYESALVEDDSRLSVMRFGAGSAVDESALDATLTAGGGWQSVGFDADNFYVYRNTGDDHASPWQLLKISRTNPVATELAHGVGLVSVASMGNGVLYLTLFKTAENQLIRVNKTSGNVFEAPPVAIDTNISVLTSANGRHLQWVVTHVGQANVAHDVSFIDESGTTLYDSPASTPIGLAESSTEDLDRSESRTRFVFAKGFGARAYSNASLYSYDAMTASARALGTLPGTAEYGDDFVFATAIGGPGTFGAGYVTRSTAGSYADAGSHVFSYDLGTADSLKNTTRR